MRVPIILGYMSAGPVISVGEGVNEGPGDRSRLVKDQSRFSRAIRRRTRMTLHKAGTTNGTQQVTPERLVAIEPAHLALEDTP